MRNRVNVRLTRIVSLIKPPPESVGINLGNGMGETKADIELLMVKWEYSQW